LKTSYKDSGVDINAGTEAVKKIKNIVKETFTSNVLTDIGSFGGCFEFPVAEYKQPVLVSSTDGVGTKLLVANMMNRHDTIGQCLVNHCVNDILTTGARPLFFLDYIGLGTLRQDVVTDIVKGLALACKENRCSLIGGEIAEMPGIYQKNDYDLAGTIVGVVERGQRLPRTIQSGDVLIGLRSTGLHTNGYSLARKVLFERHQVDDYIAELDSTLGEALLQVHRSYLNVTEPILDDPGLHGISHITGGGIEGNTTRILPEGMHLKIDWKAWEWLPIFSFIQSLGDVDTEEMRRVFNLGIGLVLIIESLAVNRIFENLKNIGENPVILGSVSN